MAGCLTENTLLKLVDGSLSAPETAAAYQHVDGCHACLLLLARITDSLLPDRPAQRSSADPATSPTLAGASPAAGGGPAAAPLPAGTTVGHYHILGLLGTGAMGVVYAARDSRLDRRVALKLLRPERSAGGERAALARRLLREAQAMARLSHAGVVMVYDVGTHGEQVFIAMEFIEGGTLRQWLRERPRSPREVLGLFLQAGRGLQAAHEAGIVHRDFKPDNILVSRAGRVCVTDFGLARMEHAPPSFTGVLAGDLARARGAGQTGTGTGAVLGTPAYMAPEQMEGAAADARADVFSFCVSLYEALYGERPFTGDTLQALRLAVLQGAVRDPSRGTQVPAAVRRALLRGMRATPDERYSTMAALLAALQEAQRRRGQRWPWAAVAAALLLIPGALALRPGHVPIAAPPWRAVPSGTSASLTGIWGSGPRDIWVVGKAGTLLHWAGSAWSPAPSGTGEDLYGIWGSGATAWAVGERGTVLRLSGTAWRAVPSGVSGRLDGVWGLGSPGIETVWVVGQGGTILRWDGGRFMAARSGTALHLRGLWGSAPGDIWAVGGADNRGVVVHFDGRAWTPSEMPVRLKGVGGTGPGDVWAAGGTLGNEGVLYRFDGRGWSRVRATVERSLEIAWLQGVGGTAAGGLWVAGDNGVLLRFQGGRWSASAGGGPVNFRAVWGPSPFAAWAVGTDGGIRHFTGETR